MGGSFVNRGRLLSSARPCPLRHKAAGMASASKLSEKWSHSAIIENYPHVAMRFGVGAAAKAEPGGHTLLAVHDGAVAVNPALFSDLPYDSQKDVDPGSMLVSIPLVILANETLPVKSVKELIDYAKANPGKLIMQPAASGDFSGWSFSTAWPAPILSTCSQWRPASR